MRRWGSGRVGVRCDSLLTETFGFADAELPMAPGRLFELPAGDSRLEVRPATEKVLAWAVRQ